MSEAQRLFKIREAVANYMQSEGCGCCEDHEKHSADEAVLAKLLNVKKYDDGSGYNFHKYRTEEKSK